MPLADMLTQADKSGRPQAAPIIGLLFSVFRGAGVRSFITFEEWIA
jgi:hypothetical protein